MEKRDYSDLRTRGRKRARREGRSILPFFLIFFVFLLAIAGFCAYYYVKKIYADEGKSRLKQLFFRLGR